MSEKENLIETNKKLRVEGVLFLIFSILELSVLIGCSFDNMLMTAGIFLTLFGTGITSFVAFGTISMNKKLIAQHQRQEDFFK